MKPKTTNKSRNRRNEKAFSEQFSNTEIVTLAVFLLGGDSRYVDTEDISVKVNELAPGRFIWRKYPDQINLENVRKRLSDAKNPQKCGYLLGSTKKGWILSESGLKFSKNRIKDLKGANLERHPLSRKEMIWKKREKIRMLASEALHKFDANEIDSITKQEAEAFFRIDDYITGKARERKLTLILNTFDDDPDLGAAVKILAKKVSKK